MILSRTILLVVFLVSIGRAHDMVQQGQAGPYDLTIYINPHARAQGFVELAARYEVDAPERVAFSITNIDEFRAGFQAEVAADAGLFRASLPVPLQAQWRVHVWAEGPRGAGQFSVPVTAAAPFEGVAVWAERALRVIGWACLSLILFIGFRRAVGTQRRLLPFSAAVASPLLFVGWAGNPVEKVFYHPAVYQRLYQPVSLDATVEMGRLRIELNDTGWVRFRSFDDLIPDHGHLMHLYALRLPELDRVYHLHPEMTAPSTLERALPDMAAGRYLMMADIVHGSGLWEAPQGELGLANAIEGGPFRGDDSGGAARPISEASFEASSFAFENGSRLVWDRPDGLRAEEPVRLAFRLEDREGRVLPDAELYMGMLGHAAIIRHDLQSFAHVHPTGSIPMASLEALNEKKKGPLAHHEHAAHKHAARVVFPYAFPQPGPYRLIIQMKRNGEVKTAFFDAIVEGSVTQTAARK